MVQRLPNLPLVWVVGGSTGAAATILWLSAGVGPALAAAFGSYSAFLAGSLVLERARLRATLGDELKALDSTISTDRVEMDRRAILARGWHLEPTVLARVLWLGVAIGVALGPTLEFFNNLDDHRAITVLGSVLAVQVAVCFPLCVATYARRICAERQDQVGQFLAKEVPNSPPGPRTVRA